MGLGKKTEGFYKAMTSRGLLRNVSDLGKAFTVLPEELGTGAESIVFKATLKKKKIKNNQAALKEFLLPILTHDYLDSKKLTITPTNYLKGFENAQKVYDVLTKNERIDLVDETMMRQGIMDEKDDEAEAAIRVSLHPKKKTTTEIERERQERQYKLIGLYDKHLPVFFAGGDVGMDKDIHTFMAMEFLKRKLNPVRTMTWPKKLFLQMVDEMAVILDLFTRKGIVHRDLKPDNIAYERKNGHILLKPMDYGLVHMQEDHLTRTGAMLGTTAYMAPEQAENSSTVDWRADQYAFGATIYRLLTNAHPRPEKVHASDRTQQTSNPRLRVLEGSERPASFVLDNDRTLQDLECIVAHMMQKSPRSRYQSTAEMREDVKRAKEGRKLKYASHKDIKHVFVPEHYSLNMVRKRRNKKLLIAGGITALALGSGLGIAYATGALDSLMK